MSITKVKTAHNFIDLTGQRFGRLVVVSRAENKGNMVRWNCQCDCGKKIVVYGNNLRRGYTQSCGCYRHECELQRIETQLKTHGESHGKNKTRLYGIWTGMRTRCFNNHAKSYERFAKNGVKVIQNFAIGRFLMVTQKI